MFDASSASNIFVMVVGQTTVTTVAAQSFTIKSQITIYV